MSALVEHRDVEPASSAQLRIDFGAHLEANYQRLVAQLYAITLDPDEAHDTVQDAYSRAWRNWAVIARSPDPAAWVRRVAVRSTVGTWRQVLARLGVGRATPEVAGGLDPRTTALLTALRGLSPADRRSVVLYHMAGMSLDEIGALEKVPPSTVHVRVSRARRSIRRVIADVTTGPVVRPDAVDPRGRVPSGADPSGWTQR